MKGSSPDYSSSSLSATRKRWRDPHLIILHLLSLLPKEDKGILTWLFFIFSFCSQKKMKGTSPDYSSSSLSTPKRRWRDPHLIILHLLSLLPWEDKGILTWLFFIFSLCSQEKIKGSSPDYSSSSLSAPRRRLRDPHLIVHHLLSLLPGEDEGILT